MKTTFDLPEELVQEVKLRAVMQRRTVKDLVAELLYLGLGMPLPGSSPHLPPGGKVEVGDDGLPVIRCRSGAPASRMRVEDLLTLERDALHKEDLLRAGLAP